MRRLSLIISCLLLIVGVLPSNAQPLTSLNAPPPPPLDYLAEGASACFVYPIVFQYGSALPEPVPMPDPTVPPSEVPSASRFTLEFKNVSGDYYHTFSWIGWKYFSTSSDTISSFTSGGTLGQSFQEAMPPIGASSGNKSNILELNDWVYGNPVNANTLFNQFSWHIDNKTIMILPKFDDVIVTGTGINFHVDNFVKARLLDYDLIHANKFLRFGLVANDVQYACFKSQTNQSTVQFRNTMPLSDVVQLHWDFGDGTSTTGISPTHRYDSTGTFTVTLSITDTLNRPSYAYGKVNITELSPISRTLFLPLVQR